MRRKIKITFLLSIFLTGCASGARLQAKLKITNEFIERAEENGAYVCAPKELALAQAHADFTANELRQGNFKRAKQHFQIADQNARLAFNKSPREKCRPKKVVIKEPPKIIVKKVDSDGDGIFDEIDKCPHQPEDFDGFEDEDGCPEEQDSDKDGLADAIDQCILDPEDSDKFMDEDGCPDLDNDLDGLTDRIDMCPLEPEDTDGFQDDNGCPDEDNDEDKTKDIADACPMTPGPVGNQGCPPKYTGVIITDTHIKIDQKIYFEYNKAVIKPISFSILNEVAKVLKDYPNITICVEGHTDSRGSERYNLKLSQRRAEAVREYLMAQGISPQRLTAKGYGESRPIASNRTKVGRAANRRVEFVRTDIKGESP
jgi:outer membrane protein OmpA-like peptidoglycan-associated protein